MGAEHIRNAKGHGMVQPVEIIGNRYEILSMIGQGAMGSVYRVKDRLSGDVRAIKRVRIEAGQDDVMDTRLALAQEFQTLASLRHPHIITVLDYGFDNHQQPYFVMPLLPSARDIVAASERVDDVGKINLLIQMLQALAYLHRRGIIHRDLKPANVLVTDDSVRVLDFGLAIQQQTTEEISGTLLYMAPEVLQQAGVTHLSDLYAVGTIAYEIFAGEHPFIADEPGVVIQSILFQPPDLSALPSALDVMSAPSNTAEIAEIVGRMLEKDPQDRYQDAYRVIRELSLSIGQEMPEESTAIRESYLEAANFIGRDDEMQQLTDALQQALDGHGSSWLIGGENGVGKSRLLDELRIQALVQGAIVLRGQEVTEGRLPYQLWREPVRRLLLGAELSDLRASILKEIVPDISTVLGRPVADIPPLSGADAQERLSLEIANLLLDQTEPIVLILEDIHWASDSLEPLKQLVRLSTNHSLLVIASYSTEERSDLPAQLPDMQVMTLERLPKAAIAQLTQSMLGVSNTQEELIDRLARETEGNIFFLVETVRALAEEAGSLDEITNMTLPENILAGGVRQVVERRLTHIPDAYLPLLRLAAVIGRAVDFDVLDAVRAGRDDLQPIDMDDWLTTCANVAVLTNWEGRWRFAHEKLRDVLKQQITPERLQDLHRQVARAIETLYPDDAAQAAVLADHWRAAGERRKEAHYAHIAGELLLNGGNFKEAITLFERALSGLGDDDKIARMQIRKLMGDVFESLSQYDTAIAYYDNSLKIARELDNALGIAAALDGQGSVTYRQGDFTSAHSYYTEALTYARMVDHQPQIAETLKGLGTVATLRGELDDAQTNYEKALTITRELGDKRGIANNLNNLGIVMRYKGALDDAQVYYEQSLALRREIGDKRGIASSLNNLGIIAKTAHRLQDATTYYGESAEIFREMGDLRGIAVILNNLGGIYLQQEDYISAIECYTEAIPIAQQIGDKRSVAHAQENLGQASLLQGNYRAALEYFEEGVAVLRSIGDKRGTASMLSHMGVTLRELDRHTQAQVSLNSALDLFGEVGDQLSMIETRHHLALASLKQDQTEKAHMHLKTALEDALTLDSQRSLSLVMGGFVEVALHVGDHARAAQLVGHLRATEDADGGSQTTYIKDLYARTQQAMTAEAIAPHLTQGEALTRAEWVAILREA